MIPELDPIAIRGKAVRIYTLLGDPAYARTAEFRDLAEAHATMLVRHRARDWIGARQALARCRGRDPRLAAFYSLYEERLAYLAANPPVADWNGIFMA